MKEKVVLVAFTGGDMCFVHVLLNALEMKGKKYDVKIIIEGEATKQVRELADPEKPFAKLYAKAREAGLIDCVCKACAAHTSSDKSAKEQGLVLCGDMSGHPALSKYSDKGYKIIIF